MADGSSNTGPAAVVNQAKALWGKTSRGKKLVAVGVIVAIAVVLGVAMTRKTGPEWMVVTETQSPDDAQELLTNLNARGVESRLTGGKVEVHADKAAEARAIAAAAGLPRTGKGFELFDGASLGQSSFAEQVNYRRALQGELARSIMALGQVEGARVHIALGKRSVFKDQQEPPSASVALHLHAGQTLSNEQVRGIRQMVAASVEGMAADSVVVVDNHGNLLDGGEAGGGDKTASLESTLSTRVRLMLERVVGEGKVSVVTTAVVDASKISETSETYDQTNPVLRSESRTVDGGDANFKNGAPPIPSGIAGTLGTVQGEGNNAGDVNAKHLQETKNYEVNRVVRQTTKPDAQLQRLHLAIVVDWKQGADGKPVARTAEELAELTALARQAAGIDDTRGDKIELRSIQFAAQLDSDAVIAPPTVAAPLLPVPLWMVGAAAGGLVALAFGVLMLRKRSKKKQVAKTPLAIAAPVSVRELERALEVRDAGGDAEKALAEGTSGTPALPAPKPIRERVLDAVRADVDRTAELLTAWLSEVPGNPVAKGAKS